MPMVVFHLEVKLATFLFTSNCKCLICDPPLSQASCRSGSPFRFAAPPPPHLFLFFSLSIVPPFPFSPQGKNKSEHGTGILNIRSTVMTSLEIQPASQINFNKIENYSTYITEKYLPKNTAQISTLLKNYSLTTEKRYVSVKIIPQPLL